MVTPERAIGRSSPGDAAARHPLGFVPQAAVRWLSPTELARAAVATQLAKIFGAYADKREQQDGRSFTQSAFIHDATDELWLDFVADTGDGFNGTFTVASLLAAEELTVSAPDGQALTLPRGAVLVMGGDQVYPTASTDEYGQRTTNVYRAALPDAAEPRPVLYAIPGNHDWYDGLTAFLRVFAQCHDVGGWRTAQRRSYYALKLPHRWWLFAVDIQLDTYIDAPQLAYFREVAAGLQPGDGVILSTARPSWYDIARGDPGSMKRLEYFIKTVIAGTGAQVRLVITGDTHHYARYVATDTGQNLLTCGLGGAYTSATHGLPDEIMLRPRLSKHEAGSNDPPSARYEKAPENWPTQDRSRQLAWGVFRLPFRNPGFWWLVGGVQSLFTVALLTGSMMWAAFFAVLVVGGAVGFTDRIPGGWARRLRFGVPHGVVQLLLAIGAFVAWRAVTHGWPGLLAVAAALPVVGLLAGFVSAEVVAAYLLAASLHGAHLNELFAAQSIEDYKGFARIHITRDGATVYPIVVERSVRRWRPRPGRSRTDPLLVPAEAVAPTLAERPFTIAREVRGPH